MFRLNDALLAYRQRTEFTPRSTFGGERGACGVVRGDDLGPCAACWGPILVDGVPLWAIWGPMLSQVPLVPVNINGLQKGQNVLFDGEGLFFYCAPKYPPF